MGSTGLNLSRVVIGSWLRSRPLGFWPFVPKSRISRATTSFTKLLAAGKLENRTRILMENQTQKKPRILCLHGFRTSAAILRKLTARWPEVVLEKLDLDFLDGPFPAQGQSDVEGIFDPPYYEWYQSNQDFTEYRNFEECMKYIEEYMINHGPFDGLLGFSQGAFISAAVPGMQKQGMALTKVPKIKFLILISGAKFGGYMFGQPKMTADAFSSPIECPSLHVIGETDFLRARGNALLESFVEPVVIYHAKGHIIPRLDEKALEIFLGFIGKIEKFPSQAE